MGQWLLSDDKALCILEADTLAEAQRFARERGHTSLRLPFVTWSVRSV